MAGRKQKSAVPAYRDVCKTACPKMNFVTLNKQSGVIPIRLEAAGTSIASG